MESLLRWGIANSSNDGNLNDAPPPSRKDLDPAIIDVILGKPDAQQMQEDMEVAMDDKRSEDERVDALDHLEMLIEQIDNANDLERLQMWKPLHSLLTSATSTHAVVLQALWVIGTALQNNPAAQDSYSALNPLPTLTAFLAPTGTTPELRSKAIYTLSGLLKHNANAVREMDSSETDGWAKLREALQDPDITVRRKAAFLLSTLLTSTSFDANDVVAANPRQPVHPNSHASQLAHPERTKTSDLTLAAVLKHNIIPAIVQSLTNPLPYGEDGDINEADLDFEEKAVGVLRSFADSGGQLDAADRKILSDWYEIEKNKNANGDSGLAARWGLSTGELQALAQKMV